MRRLARGGTDVLMRADSASAREQAQASMLQCALFLIMIIVMIIITRFLVRHIS
jgi:hypothetical protein